MNATKSIEKMSAGLSAAVSRADWHATYQYAERLKAILLDGVARNDPLAIRCVGSALQSSGQQLELGNELQMETNALAVAWQLRADAATAALAHRIRPVARVNDQADEDVAAQLLKILRKSNAPLSNGDLAERLAKDPATVSRTLKRLKSAGKISQWRGGRRVFNVIRSRWPQPSPERDNIYVLQAGKISKPSAPSDPTNAAPGEAADDAGFRNPAKDVVQQLLMGASA